MNPGCLISTDFKHVYNPDTIVRNTYHQKPTSFFQILALLFQVFEGIKFATSAKLVYEKMLKGN